MITKQISVFVENRPGRLAEVTEAIAKNGINIRALSIADTTHFGILRIIVENPNEVEKMLHDMGMTVSITSVLAVKLEDRPGSLAEVLKLLADENITIEYMYAFISKEGIKAAFVVMRIEEDLRAVKLLKDHGYEGPSIN
jgi:ACT domain-containing protein